MRRLLVLLISIFLVASCAKEEKTASPKYLAKVGDVVLTEKDIEAIPISMRLEEKGLVPKGHISQFWPEKYDGADCMKKTIAFINCAMNHSSVSPKLFIGLFLRR